MHQGTGHDVICLAALQGMEPEAGRVGAARVRCLLQPEQYPPKPWH